MSRRTTIYMGKLLEEHTTNLAERDSVSGRINRTVERYISICQQHRGRVDLTVDEADFLTLFLGDDWADPLQIKYLPQEIRQAKSDIVDVNQLADKIDNVSFADLIALVEVLGR